MESPLHMKIRTINWLVACIIGLFMIFPDVVLYFERTNFDNGGFKNEERFRPALPQPNDNEQRFEPMDSPTFRMPPDRKFGFENENKILKLACDFLFFMLSARGLLFLNYHLLNGKRRIMAEDRKLLGIIVFYGVVFCFLCTLLYSLIEVNFMQWGFRRHGFINGMLMFRFFFLGIVAGLFGFITRLIYKQQLVVVENERLQRENIQNRFDALSTQVNPHFFFNSLNSLSSLVRDGECDKSLKYIDKLSGIFRYVLKSKPKELVPLSEELGFLDAFRYLLEIRFENKLSFDIQVEEIDRNTFRLPVLSLQPLIENVVKHNVVSEDDPMEIQIYIDDSKMLCISNPIQRKIDVETGMGIGVENLDKRYRLLTGAGITIIETESVFTVQLPLLR